MISIVIPHYGADQLLHDCLAAIHDTVETCELVVVDNNGTGRLHPADVLIRNRHNVGYGRACNQGAYASSGDRIVFLNNDTVAHPGWAGWIVAALEDHPLVGAKLLYPDGRVQHAGVELRDEDGVLTAYNMRRGGADRYDEPRAVDAVTGACLAIRRDVFLDLGGFDEGFRNGYEDVDLCLRAGGAWYEPRAILTHHESASGPERWTHVAHNVARLQEKHRWPITIS